MSPGRLDPTVIADRASWIRWMLAGIRELPLESLEAFTRERHHVAAAESYLRRAIEALVDLGRHILAKRYAIAASEYKAIPTALARTGVLSEQRAQVLSKVCGYRNRMVHFYHQVSDRELYEICTRHLVDLEDLVESLLSWIVEHPDPAE